MGLGSSRRFKTLKAAKSFVTKAQGKGFFVGRPLKRDGMYVVSLLTKRGHKPIFTRGL